MNDYRYADGIMSGFDMVLADFYSPKIHLTIHFDLRMAGIFLFK